MPGKGLPRLGVFKFASCDGCQLTLLDCEEELLPLAEAVEIADFREASSTVLEGPFDISLVEGSITTLKDARRILEIRAQSKILVTIGACATSGGIQALRNFSNIEEFRRAVYAHPEYISTLSSSTPIQDHVSVDLELRGCPIDKRQLLDVLSALLGGRTPNLPTESVCAECKRQGNVCVMVGKGIPCLGPVTQSGCGALCPHFDRGCYGCFGPMETPNAPSLLHRLGELGMDRGDRMRVFRTFNAASPAFRAASESAMEDGKP